MTPARALLRKPVWTRLDAAQSTPVVWRGTYGSLPYVRYELREADSGDEDKGGFVSLASLTVTVYDRDASDAEARASAITKDLTDTPLSVSGLGDVEWRLDNAFPSTDRDTNGAIYAEIIELTANAA